MKTELCSDYAIFKRSVFLKNCLTHSNVIFIYSWLTYCTILKISLLRFIDDVLLLSVSAQSAENSSLMFLTVWVFKWFKTARKIDQER